MANKLKKIMWSAVAKHLGSSKEEMMLLGWDFRDIMEIHKELFGGKTKA